MMMIELTIVQREKIDIYKERNHLKHEERITKRKALIRPEDCGEIGTAPSPRLAGR